MVRKLAFVFAVLFVIVVVMGWMPHAITAMQMTPDGPERTMYGLFKMSMLDDVTHGLSALLLLAASLTSRRASLLALTAFGWYYACDAAFFLINGFIGHKPLVSNVLLNLPHVIIASVMLGMVYWLAPREDRLAAVRPATAAA
jgi:Na+-transporting methylmalonyl-CoA/oxaloacetate decarboxylase gamma subunit